MSTLVDRLEVAKGIRKGLELWPDANHWCQGNLRGEGPNGEQQRCTLQMLADGFGLSDDFFYRCPLYKAAEAEVLRVAQERGIYAIGNICAFNNGNDFETVKSVVEQAASSLEQTA